MQLIMDKLFSFLLSLLSWKKWEHTYLCNVDTN